MSTLGLLLLLTAGLCGLFAAAYLFARRVDNYGIVDVVWSYAFAPFALLCAWASPAPLARRILVVTLAACWSIRLGTHLARRVASHHPHEDSRYRQLRRDWSGNFAPKMFGFFQLQALSVVLLATPFLLATRNAAASVHPLEIAGAIVWLAGMLGETLADAQLTAFKRDAANRGRVCDVGLWRYSRHPNYFFEWVIWIGFALLALPAPLGWLGMLAPAIIAYLLLKVTGIPLAEEQSLRSKGDAYRDYQRRTSAFIPLPPRHTLRASPKK
jgi:steroid 5-alpha reductase family enzyme